MNDEKEVKNKEKDGKEVISVGERLRREVLSWFWVILIFLFIHGSIVQARVIPSGSMEQTLLVGDHLLVDRFGYSAEIPFTGIRWTLWREPKRQQIVVFRRPGQADFVKRIIGMPGDTLEVRNGAVYINGAPLDEPYAYNIRPFEEGGPWHVPPGHYFMMGDNRGNSNDSRMWENPYVPREDIIGTPLVIYMSIEAPGEDAWQPGHLPERFRAYLAALVRPERIRWGRLLHTF
ncbi:MAG: signal peptidase I [Firmicutes bacterium]|nr:signal peptidase I [Bacillota bacterium]